MTYVGTAVMPASWACCNIAATSSRAGVTVEELHDLVAVEPDVGRAVGEHVGIADVEPVDEVGLQQPLLERRLRDRTRRLGEPQQPMGEQRVRAQGAVHPELDAGLVAPSR